jgi:hypothetical protein
MKTKILRTLITLFIISNFMMMIRAQLHENSPVINFIYKPITFLQNYLSMWRGWSMFAPNPLRINAFIDAKITFQDGEELIWDFPKPAEDNLIERYVFGERYRKYMTDGLRLDNKAFLREDAAKFVLRKIAPEHYKKKPVSVTLRRRWQDIADWNVNFIPHRTPVDKSKFNTFEFYTYKVEAYANSGN